MRFPYQIGNPVLAGRAIGAAAQQSGRADPDLRASFKGLVAVASSAPLCAFQGGSAQASGPMVKASVRLVTSLCILAASCFLLRLSGWFGLGVLVGLIVSILYWFDTAAQIRATSSAGRSLRVIGVLMVIPQALFGLLCCATGLAIIIWVLYNTLVERQPQYTGGFLTLGIGPALVLFGCGWLLPAVRRGSQSKDGG